MSGPSLRDKFSNLLPGYHQRSLPYEHQQLLKILGIIDETI
jgi:hypothetical protein